MIRSMPKEIGTSDMAKVRINPLKLRKTVTPRDRENIVDTIPIHQRIRHLIVVINGVGQMNANRSDVAHRQGNASGELPLNIEIPLHFVAARRIRLDTRGLEGAQAEQIKRPARKAGGRGISYGPL